MWRDDAYVLDMLLAARKVLEFTEGIDWERFGRDELVQNAVMRQIQIIGEAARSVSPGYRAEHAQVPWAEIIGMRNRLVHEYFRILPRRVWDVVDKAEGDFSTMEREAVVVEDPNFEAVCFHA